MRNYACVTTTLPFQHTEYTVQTLFIASSSDPKDSTKMLGIWSDRSEFPSRLRRYGSTGTRSLHRDERQRESEARDQRADM